MRYGILAAAAACMVMLAAGIPRAAEKASPVRPAKDAPTRILSDSMVYESKKLRVTFSGNVHVTRGDMQLWAKRLDVHFHPSKKAGGKDDGLGGTMGAGEVRELVATGDVRMQSGERKGTCGRATYDVDAALLTMMEDPRLSEPGRDLTGGEIRYYIDEVRSEVRAVKGRRVEAVFEGPAVKRKGK